MALQLHARRCLCSSSRLARGADVLLTPKERAARERQSADARIKAEQDKVRMIGGMAQGTPQ